MYLSVGYPLGIKFDDDGIACYAFSLNNKALAVSYDDFCLWVDITQHKKVKHEHLKLIPFLKELGLIIEANTLPVLLEKILPLTPIRQGTGWIHENKTCIILGRELFYPTNMQAYFWIASSGLLELSDIFNLILEDDDILVVEKLNKTSENIKSDVMSAIIGLMRHGNLILQ